MWVLMGLVILSFLTLRAVYEWQERTRSINRRSAQFLECEHLIQGIKNFTEHEGLYPTELSQVRTYSRGGFSQPGRWTLRETNPGVLMLRLSALLQDQEILVRISFKPREMSVEYGQWRAGKRALRFEVTRKELYILTPKDNSVSRRTYARLKARIYEHRPRASEHAVTYAFKKIDEDEARALAQIAKDHKQSQRWNTFAPHYMAMSRKLPDDSHFQSRMRHNPRLYLEWFKAKQQTMPKAAFYEFALEEKQKLPAVIRDRCFELAVKYAYNAGDYLTAIQLCERWGDVSNPDLHAASLLAAGSPSAARYIYEKARRSIDDQMTLSSLEQALLAENVLFTLDPAKTDIKPFFPKLSDFLIFPDLKH